MQGRSRSCNRIFVALEDCQRKHPRQAEVCEQLNKAAAWCAVRELCPSEGEDLYRGRAKVCLAFHGVQGMCAEGPKRSFNEFMTLLDMRACVCRRARAPARARSFMCACVRVAEVAALPPPPLRSGRAGGVLRHRSWPGAARCPRDLLLPAAVPGRVPGRARRIGGIR